MIKKIILLIFTDVFFHFSVFAQQIQPEDLEYLAAFRLPDGSGRSDWNYSGGAMAYYPSGDASGDENGFSGSIFAIGHDHQQYVSEISIPVPVISSRKNLEELNTATTLQDFSDMTGGMFGYLEMPTAGLAYLPPQGDQITGKLHFCWGQHLQYQEASHGWCELDLSQPRPAGPWHFGNLNNYSTNDYIFEIPKAWADIHLSGKYLASGRFREGVWSGLGTALYAYAPWVDGNPPAPLATLTSITRLLLYGGDDPNLPEIIITEEQKMYWHHVADQWTGACWLTAGENSAVVFIGSKGLGNGWYGFSDGTVWAYEGPYPEIPDPPHDQRGFWADSIRAQMLFYDPADLAEVAHGTKNSWEPQPYAVLDINQYLFDPGYNYWRQKRLSLGAACFDRERGYLYIFERRADGEKSLIHTWKVNDSSTEIKRSFFHNLDFQLLQNCPNPFNASITIPFQISKKAFVELKLWDMSGREIRCLLRGELQAGDYKIVFRQKNLSQAFTFTRLAQRELSNSENLSC